MPSSQPSHQVYPLVHLGLNPLDCGVKIYGCNTNTCSKNKDTMMLP